MYISVGFKMALKHDLNDILIKGTQKITSSVLNKSFQKLLENDFSIVSPIKMEPVIWECKWFNNTNISGYSQGDVCWINTEDVDEFIENRHNVIYDYAKNNVFLKNVIEPFQANNQEINELYRNILSGYQDNYSSIQLEPLFELGNITKQSQIRISKIDNNKHSVFDDDYWMDFFIRDQFEDDLKTIFDESIKKHLEAYHLSCEDISLSDYADYSLSNVSKIQNLQKHVCDYHTNINTGLDYIKSESEEYSTLDFVEADISSHKYETTTTRWYELTGDAIYRLNNSIPASKIGSLLNQVKNYAQFYEFIPTDEKMGFGNIALGIQATSANIMPGYDFPNYFKYNEEQYNQVSTCISDYNVYNYCIGEIETASPREDISSLYSSITPLSTDDITKIPIEYRGLYKANKLQSISSSLDVEEKIFSVKKQWVKQYKSGYVVEGGFIKTNILFTDQIYTIKLLKPYEYMTTQRSIYGDIEKITEGIEYSGNNTLKLDNSYTVSISPVSDSFKENDNIEIVGMRNDSFDVLVGPNTPREFYYQVQGLIENENG